MTKTCPNCGVNSPDNAKHCIECGENIEDVPINKVKEAPASPKTTANTASSSSSDENNALSNIGCIVMILAIVILIVVAGFYFFGGSGDSNQQNVTITFGDVYASNFLSSNNEIVYDYFVNGYLTNIPNDNEKYMLKTIYYDSNGKELTSTTEKLSKFKNDEKNNYASMISFYQTKNYIDVDHVTVQVIKDNSVVNEFTTQMNKNKLTSNVGSSSGINTSSNLSNISR